MKTMKETETYLYQTSMSNRPLNALKKAGITTVEQISKLSLAELKAVKGLGSASFDEVKFILNKECKVKLRAKPVDKALDFKKKLTRKFIKEEHLNSYDKNVRSEVWKNSLGAWKRILKKWPEEEFWNNFELGFKLNSLFYFLTENGTGKVNQEYAKYKAGKNKIFSEKKEEVKLESQKVGDDIDTTPKKPKSLKDFLGK